MLPTSELKQDVEEDEDIPHYSFPDPFTPPTHRPLASFINALLATALFRCWHILVLYGVWSTTVALINAYVRHNKFILQPTLLTVLGTVIGFVISYRTTSSFERYNEGRRLWSQIILSSRTFARLVWFHIPEVMQTSPADVNLSEAEKRARVIIEKKTVINLIEAFAVAVKHYLRGEDGIYYTDIYYLVKHLPTYALPTSLPPASATELTASRTSLQNQAIPPSTDDTLTQRRPSPLQLTSPHETENSSTPVAPKHLSFLPPPLTSRSRHKRPIDHEQGTPKSAAFSESELLMPAWNPPKYHLFDLFPFSLLVHLLTKRGSQLKGKKAARLRAKLRGDKASHNLPLEISLYLSSYIAAIQSRKVIEAPTATNLLAALTGLVDALTGLERILTTPIPWSYSAHLWAVTSIYCLTLPLQLWQPFKWLSVPATIVASFIFFGFLVAGEEIENPFGYDKNDLNMDHFTHNIIRNELHALTAAPAPSPATWAFSLDNDLVLSGDSKDERVTPQEWLTRGLPHIQAALAHHPVHSK